MPSNKNHFNEQLQEPHHFRLNVVSSIHNNNNALVWVCRFVCGQKTEGMECFVVVLECVRAPPVSGFVCVRVKVKHLASLWGATLAPFGTVRPIDNVDRVDSLINHHRHNDLLLKWKVRTPFFFFRFQILNLLEILMKFFASWTDAHRSYFHRNQFHRNQSPRFWCRFQVFCSQHS